MRTLLLLLTPVAALTLCAADTTQPVVVSATSPQVGLAPDSLATIYGPKLATQTVAASTVPFPTSLGDMPGVILTDSAGENWQVGLIFVSPDQMNIWIPAGAATGAGTIRFPFTGLPPGVTAALRIVPVTLQVVAPGIFTADGNGSGVVAASAIQAGPIGQSPLTVFTCSSPGVCSPVPITLGIDTPIYLSLYGTGIRGWNRFGTSQAVTVTIGNQTFPALYAGPQPTIPGLDQINVPISLSLRGSGLVNVSITVAGTTSNVGQIVIN